MHVLISLDSKGNSNLLGMLPAIFPTLFPNTEVPRFLQGDSIDILTLLKNVFLNFLDW